MKTFAGRYPFLFAVTVSLAGILGIWWPAWTRALPEVTQVVLGRSTECLIVVALLTVLGWWRNAGFVAIRSWRTLIPYVPLGLVALLIVTSVVIIPGSRVQEPDLLLFGALSVLAGGFAEEGLYRGVLLRAFMPRGILKAALLSATVFSLVHLANLLMGQDLGATAIQLLRAFLLGFAFSTTLACARNIWPLVILHATINFSGFLSSGSLLLISTESPSIAAVLAEVVVYSLLAGFGVWLLRRAQRKTRSQAAATEQLLVLGDHALRR